MAQEMTVKIHSNLMILEFRVITKKTGITRLDLQSSYLKSKNLLATHDGQINEQF